MKLSKFVGLGSFIGVAVAVDPKLCPGDGFLVFNSTNVAALAPCSAVNYLCMSTNATSDDGGYAEYNATTGPVPENCREFGWNIAVNKSVTGPLSIPGVVDASQAVFQGQWPRYVNIRVNDSLTGEEPLNLTSLDLPDLINVVSMFEIQWADKIKSLSVPKLISVGEGIDLDLTGENPPAMNLSFPSLYHVEGGIWLSGNIDAIDLPALNYTMNINITSTGNLDCEVLAPKVVNATSLFYRIPEIGGAGNNSFVCNSKKGNVTTFHAAPTSSSGGEIMGVSWALIALIGMIELFGYIL